jgi:beta-mannanase
VDAKDYRLGPEQPNFSLAAILSGRHDSFIKNWAVALAQYRKPILMRFAHEMNGNWYPWSTGVGGNTPAQYVAVWRKLHDTFTANGATNVLWVWSPNVDNADPALYFPGDKYVDWLGLDGYNSASWGVWRSFNDVFGSSYARLTALSSRPVMIAEVGTSEGSSNIVGDKATWIRNAYAKEIPQTFPRIGAVLWFHVNMSAIEGPGREWQIDSSAMSLSAYREVIATSTYQSSLRLK